MKGFTMSFSDQTKFSVKKMTTLTVFTALALGISVAESMLPPLLPIPGIRLGLANIVTLILLQYYKPHEAFIVLLMRIFLSAFFAGQFTSLFYSLTGGIFCFLVMLFFNRFLNGRFLFLTSIFGALAHNAGQLLTAYVFTGSIGVSLYIPVLTLSGIVTGLFTGLCAHYLKKYLMPHIMRD